LATSGLEKNRIKLTTLRVFIKNESQSQTCAWVLFDAKGHLIRQGEDGLNHLPLADFSEVVVPADWVTLTPAKLPKGDRNRILKALPYLVEDHLISSPELLQVVIAEQSNANDVILASIDKQKLKKTISILQASNLNLQRVFPSTLVTPIHEKAWVMVCDSQGSFLRLSNCRGFALEQDDSIEVPITLRLAIERAKSDLQLPDEIVVYGDKAIDLSQHFPAWANLLGIKFTLIKGDWKTSTETSEMNFLQGDFYVKHRTWAWLEQAKPAFTLLIVIILVNVLGSCIDWMHRLFEKRQLTSQMTSLFKTTFPEAVNVVNPPLQMQRKLADLQHAAGDAGNHDLIPLLARISHVADEFSQVKTMVYQDGALSLEMHAINELAAQTIAHRLTTSDSIAVVENIKPNQQGVSFTLVFKAGDE
jgi:general secretion pathway protein L